jgi:hypothetical protein
VYLAVVAAAAAAADVVARELRPVLLAAEAAVPLRQPLQPIPAECMALAAACVFPVG